MANESSGKKALKAGLGYTVGNMLVKGLSFLAFNLLCAPCFAAMGAIKREMNNAKWTLAAIGYMCGFAYAVSLLVYQLGGLITGEVAFGLGTVAAIAVLAVLIYFLVRPNKYNADYKKGSAPSVKLDDKVRV